jgi:hypothetical protein
LLSPFWSGFVIGAVLFMTIGVFAGVFTAAMCQAAAGPTGADIGERRQGRLGTGEKRVASERTLF